MRRPSPRELALLAILAATLAACDRRAFDSECDLVVLNETQCSVAIYVDGREAMAVRSGTERAFTDIGPGRHVLEALDSAGRLVQRRTVELATGEDFYWTLESC
ncbi:MAG TPA: hypothetical protein VMT19_12300 [Thermoanaerobaculaceae bacterium]|nr:hypothetical protein [Thermoanaerobaculaceae bacterium]